jgi:hypothetical protein
LLDGVSPAQKLDPTAGAFFFVAADYERLITRRVLDRLFEPARFFTGARQVVDHVRLTAELERGFKLDDRRVKLAITKEALARPIVLLRDLDHRARRPLQRGQVLRGWDICQRRRRQTQQENPTSRAHDLFLSLSPSHAWCAMIEEFDPRFLKSKSDLFACFC